MKASRYVVIGVAAVAALLLALLVRGLVSGNSATKASAAQQVVVENPTVKILVAARDLKVGERISEADLAWKKWPADALNPTYFTDGTGPVPITKPEEKKAETEADKAKDKVAKTGETIAEAADAALNPTRGMESLLGGVVREEILMNEPIIARKIVRADEGGFMAVMLEPGMRAMAVPVSVENTAGGFILPGDRVDIIVSTEVRKPDGGSAYVTRQVLRNVKVLAIDQAVSPQKDQQAVIGATATLEVSPEDGQSLAQAKAMGTLSLMLRSYADVAGPSGRVAALPDQSVMVERKVTVYRNGQPSDVVVSQ